MNLFNDIQQIENLSLTYFWSFEMAAFLTIDRRSRILWGLELYEGKAFVQRYLCGMGMQIQGE